MHGLLLELLDWVMYKKSWDRSCKVLDVLEPFCQTTGRPGTQA